MSRAIAIVLLIALALGGTGCSEATPNTELKVPDVPTPAKSARGALKDPGKK